jgi:phosphoribosylformimino-5-aminoimidazole carboxamide ribotide isomerase
MSAFEIIPAIDLRAGKVVRLYQGDYGRQTHYPVDPLEQAHRYRAAGAEWLHVVDLDGARDGGGSHLELIAKIARAGSRVQSGGGVRREEDLRRLFDAGVERVVVGSMAVREPAVVERWLADFGAERIVLALDARWKDGAWRVPTAGWTTDEGGLLDGLARHYAAAGARHVLCTDIDRDGTLQGPNLALYRHVHANEPGLRLQVSGGVRAIDDIPAARGTGAAAIVLGRALLEGRFTVEEALSC